MSCSNIPSMSSDSMTRDEADEDSVDSVEKCQVDASEVERLRRFLVYCLAVDYGLQSCCPDTLRKDDWLHFTHLGKLCYEDYICKHPTSSTPLSNWTDDCCNHKEVERYLLEAARMLDVPTDAVVDMLHLFVSSTSWLMGGVASSIPLLQRNGGLFSVASKLSLDQYILFDMLLSPLHMEFRRHIEDAHAKICETKNPNIRTPTTYERFAECWARANHIVGRQRLYTGSTYLRILYGVASYLGEVMQESPSDNNCWWWERGLVKWWAAMQERALFQA